MKNDNDTGQFGGTKKFLYKRNSGRGALFGDDDDTPKFNFQPQTESKKPLLNLDEVWSIRNNVNAGKIGGQNMPQQRDLDRTVESSLYSRYNQGGNAPKGPGSTFGSNSTGEPKPISYQNRNSINSNSISQNSNVYSPSLQTKNFHNQQGFSSGGKSFQNQNLQREKTRFAHRDAIRGIDFDGPVKPATQTSATLRRPNANGEPITNDFIQAPQRDAVSFSSSVVSPSAIQYDMNSITSPRSRRDDLSMMSNQSGGRRNRGGNTGFDDLEFDF